MTDDELGEAFQRAWTNEGFLSREHEEARLAAGRVTLRRFREAALREGASIPAYVEKEFAFYLDGDRIRGRWDRVDVEPSAGRRAETGPATGATPEPMAGLDVVSPTLDLAPERVTITDYKSSAVDDRRKAAARARDSLQLQIYAMGWQAQTGRLPDAVALHFLESGVTGTAPVDEKRLAGARGVIATAATGIRKRSFDATPTFAACTNCSYRDICPASVAR